MYKIVNKKRLNTDDIIKKYYEKRIVEENDLEEIDLGGENCFSTTQKEKDYYTKKLGYQAILALATASQKIYKNKYKKYLNKKLTIDIMAAEKENIVGILLRYKKRMVAVLENWQIVGD